MCELFHTSLVVQKIAPHGYRRSGGGSCSQIKQGCTGCCPDCKQNQNRPCSRASSCREPWSRFALGLLFVWFEISFDLFQALIECNSMPGPNKEMARVARNLIRENEDVRLTVKALEARGVLSAASDACARLQAGPRRHCVKAQGLCLPFRPVAPASSSISRRINLFRNHDKVAKFATLGISVSALYLLSRASAEQVKHVGYYIEAGARLSVADIKRLTRADPEPAAITMGPTSSGQAGARLMNITAPQEEPTMPQRMITADDMNEAFGRLHAGLALHQLEIFCAWFDGVPPDKFTAVLPASQHKQLREVAHGLCFELSDERSETR